MIQLDETNAKILARKESGENPYMHPENAKMMHLICRIDPATFVRLCDAAANTLMLLSENKATGPAFEQS